MLSKKNIVKINGIYTSLLYEGWFAAEYIVNMDAVELKVRMPYKTREQAEQMIAYLKGVRPTAPAPDWHPVINIVAQEKSKHTK